MSLVASSKPSRVSRSASVLVTASSRNHNKNCNTTTLSARNSRVAARKMASPQQSSLRSSLAKTVSTTTTTSQSNRYPSYSSSQNIPAYNYNRTVHEDFDKPASYHCTQNPNQPILNFSNATANCRQSSSSFGPIRIQTPLPSHRYSFSSVYSTPRPTSSNYKSQIEQQVLNAQKPLPQASNFDESDLISVNGERGYLANKSVISQWRGALPLDQYPINQDPNPEIIVKKATPSVIDLKQEVVVRYLRPPTPPAPEPIIIREEPSVKADPAPPLVIRQVPNRPETPAPLVVREAPPKPPW
jgi:hypothetical protein